MITDSPFAGLDQQLDKLIERGMNESGQLSQKIVFETKRLLTPLQGHFQQRITSAFVSEPLDELSEALLALFSDPKTLPYFESMTSLAYFYWSWLGEQLPEMHISDRDALAFSLIYGAIGYKIIDVLQDSEASETKPLYYLAKFLISSQEQALLLRFSGSLNRNSLLSKYDRLYCNVGLREQHFRYKENPFRGLPVSSLGHKSAPLFSYYALPLDQLGRADQITDYEQLFFHITAAIQILDDLGDAEADLADGHITFVSEDFVRTIGRIPFGTRDAGLSDVWRTYLNTSDCIVRWLSEAEAQSRTALEIAERREDSVFQLFILLKQFSITEKLIPYGNRP